MTLRKTGDVKFVIVGIVPRLQGVYKKNRLNVMAIQSSFIMNVYPKVIARNMGLMTMMKMMRILNLFAIYVHYKSMS